MLTTFCVNERNELCKVDCPLTQALWIDVVNPTLEEHKQLEQNADVLLPWHHELHQLEFSNRFYEENDALYLSLPVVTKAAPVPESHMITFILKSNTLVTLRYSDPNPIHSFIEKLDQQPVKVTNQFEIFYFLIEKIVGTLADAFELIDERSDELALILIGSIDSKNAMDSRGRNKPNLNKKLRLINYLQYLLAKGHQSLSNLNLLLAFFQQETTKLFNGQVIPDFSTLKEDIQHLSRHGEHLSHKLGFQLQSSLGLISIAQTDIIKVFTVLAMIFMPPTLIASIYGMNFRHMPELSSPYAYPVVLILMLISAILPYRFFKNRGWI